MIIHNKKRKRKNVLTPSARARRERFVEHINSLQGIYTNTNTRDRSMFDANVFLCSSCGRSISDHPTLVIGSFSTRPYHGDLCPFASVDKF